MSDLTKYAHARAGRDPEFADGLEVAERLATKKSAISRIENSAGSIRFSTLERYARAICWQLSLELHPPRKSSKPASLAR